MRHLLFTLVVTAISRAFIARDRLLDRMPRVQSADLASSACTRHTIPSGRNLLDAVFVAPKDRQAYAAILLCHGIGETVEHWLSVQLLFATGGVASLVFDYSGYGRSTGFIDASQCEEDAIAAFRRLQELTPATPVSLLGFSLGSGIAAAIFNRVPAKRLFLCAAFPSFRDAAHSAGLPKMLRFLVAPLWRADDALRQCVLPITIIHGEEDKLFSVQSARNLRSFCPQHSELVLVAGLTHNAPIYTPQPAYWNLILERL